MPRPKTGLPIKQKLTLTVSAEVREYLDILSRERKQSISEMVSQYAEQEVKKLNYKQSRQIKKEKEATKKQAEQRSEDMYRAGRLGYNMDNGRYGLLISDLWEHEGFHCGDCLEVRVDGEWVQTCMEMNPEGNWYLVNTPFVGKDLEYVRARIPFK